MSAEKISITKVRGGSGEISTLSLLGIVFIVLKLVGIVNWSWWWILAPFWGQVVLCILELIVLVLTMCLCSDKLDDKKASPTKKKTNKKVKKDGEKDSSKSTEENG